jgi:hypothetical protein
MICLGHRYGDFNNARAADPGDELFPASNSLLLPLHFEFVRNLPAGVFDTHYPPRNRIYLDDRT